MLTDEQIEKLLEEHANDSSGGKFYTLVRKIEKLINEKTVDSE